MKLTILQTGEAPPSLRDQYGLYVPMFERMFARAGVAFDYEIYRVFDGALPEDPGAPEAVLITGSSAGVYDDLAWLDPLRDFIRRAYAARTPMLGVCFGHQVMADALGGDVRKSEKGWGLGRHVYDVVGGLPFLDAGRETVAIACSHQDQVIEPPAEARVFLRSEFTPNAGLVYANGAAISLQPHPEFDDDYVLALAELRRGKVPDDVVDAAATSVARPSDSHDMARYLGEFLKRA